MSLLNTIAKLYIRLTFRDDGEFDPLRTQRELNVPGPPRKIVERCEPLDDAPVRAFWIDRHNAGSGVLVYLHGGAFYFGPVKEHWEYLGRICKSTGMAGVMVDYGIAPQDPFPVGLAQVVRLVADDELSRRHWFFLGDSSGAAMAVSATFELAKEGMPLPAGLILMSPWMDLNLDNPEIAFVEQGDPMMSVKRLSNAARCYAGDANLSDPQLSPMFGDLSVLPPTLIQMGTADLLLPDARKFHQKCIAAGVDVKYEEYADAFHDFMMLSILPEAKRALRSQADFLTSVEKR